MRAGDPPGYGFLSRKTPILREAWSKSGFKFHWPHPETIRLMGDKVSAKAAMKKAGVPGGAWFRGALPDDPRRSHQDTAKAGWLSGHHRPPAAVVGGHAQWYRPKRR